MSYKIYKVLMWTYDRGTWQYDLIVALILSFVFFTPRALFNTEKIDKRILAYSQAPVALPLNGNDKSLISLEEPTDDSASRLPKESFTPTNHQDSAHREHSGVED
ncbi:MAG: hypothetical protein HYR55_03240 [Acidobacteria bacterium]|nr:hypothetical protein [Acidobacteriota bacterium]MBI3657181.1 hypothetical protein [Acidobacteriota bacterium]